MSVVMTVIIFVLGMIGGATAIMVIACIAADRELYGTHKEPTREEWHETRL